MRHGAQAPKSSNRGEVMKKSMFLTGVATFAVAVIAVQIVRAPGVVVAPQAGTQSVAPFEMMLKARDLPTESVENPV